MFFHEWGPDERWGAHRTVKIRVVAMHVLFMFIIFQEEKQFSGPWAFQDFSVFDDAFRKQAYDLFLNNDPEVSGSGRGASPTY